MIDIIITTFNRKELFQEVLDNLISKTKNHYRLFICDDNSDDGTKEFLNNFDCNGLSGIILNKERQGVVFNFNQLWNLVDLYDTYHYEN
ncbi:MAG: glycosyltransferase family 2 protein, partial [Asgard group archaeon]|nr:glycosyltransferase family 2 protein [Asgard group archaeon]